MKKSILFLLALFSVTMTTQAVDYYYRGNQNSWGATKITGNTGANGLFYYYKASASTSHEFKVTDNNNSNWSGNNWGTGNYVDGYNGADVNKQTSSDNCKVDCNSEHYILLYVGNNGTNPVICASKTLPNGLNTVWVKHNWGGTNWSYKQATKNADGTFSVSAKYGETGCNLNAYNGENAQWWYDVADMNVEAGLKKGDEAVFTVDPVTRKISVTKKVNKNIGSVTVTMACVQQPNIYYFGGVDGATTYPDWPGVKMNDNGNGTYSYKVDNVDLDLGLDYVITLEEVNENKWKSGDLNARADVNHDASILNITSIAMHGNFSGAWKDSEHYSVNDENYNSATLKMTIENGNYEFGMRIGASDNWTSNGKTFTRSASSAEIKSGGSNLILTADMTGEYEFKWTYKTNTLEIVFPEEEVVVPHTYTVAGVDFLFGTSWNAADGNNDMIENGDGTYTWKRTNVEFAETKEVKFKVCQDHAWDVAYPASDYVLNITEKGYYTITITYTPADGNKVEATAEKTAEYEGETPIHTYTVAGVAALCGVEWDYAATANDMTTADNVSYTWSKTGVEVKGNLEFKVFEDHSNSTAYPSNNWVIDPANYEGAAIYDVIITFNAETKEITVAMDKTGDVTPVVYTYYLMGVNDDWTTGIEMEVNTDAENEVMLTCQPVNGEVKIKRLGDDASEHWYGAHSLKAEEGNLGTNADAEGGDGNIALAEGIYNFYFNTADGKLWIAAATDCETEPTEETIELYDFAWEISDGSLVMSADWNETPVYVEIYDAGETLESGTYNAFLNLGGWAEASIDKADASVELFIWPNGAGAEMTGTFVGETTGTKYNLSLTGTMPSGGGEATEYNIEESNVQGVINPDGNLVLQGETATIMLYAFDPTITDPTDYEAEVMYNDRSAYAYGFVTAVTDGTNVEVYGEGLEGEDMTGSAIINASFVGTILQDGAAVAVEVSDLKVMSDEDLQIAMLSGTGQHLTLGNLTFELYLSNYTGGNGEYQLTSESLVYYPYRSMSRPAAITGSITKSYSSELNTDVYAGTVTTTIDEQDYEINLTMYYIEPEAVDMTVTNATITLDEGTLFIEGEWNSYPFIIWLDEWSEGKQYQNINIEVGEWGENYYGMLMQDPTKELAITVENNTLTFKGYFIKGDNQQLHNVTISGTMPQTVTEITLTEGDNSGALATEGVVTVTVNRSFEQGNLYTIALPFTINNAASVFGYGTVVYNFANLAYDKTNEEYILGFTTVNKIEAGKPYLIQPGQNVNGFVAENVTLSGATSISQKVTVDKVEKTATMTAVLSKTTTGGNYWLAEDRYLYNDKVDMPALRALFVLPTTPSGMPARARVALKEDAATGVEDLFTTEAPVKVIVNGQLIIIRDGEMYNVQGQLVK